MFRVETLGALLGFLGFAWINVRRQFFAYGIPLFARFYQRNFRIGAKRQALLSAAESIFQDPSLSPCWGDKQEQSAAVE
ncbi:hypothetical protein WS83_14290 [Burkholderia sp. MSMB2042]|nr:hypothetical protein WS78_04515 [Burkholderia savannae]KVG40481.1 hypothetical protein WS77_18280 [Burkholderia sp. MSMB0265]KVG84641.1 hypothetical protein WS81_05385 [Burkholderia sp. MSMB2040]KVG90209.1 hypothetical protein WS82_18950 [Burkholderia sp. MSMB2041]KVG91214.1 hypothetical protein WS83_14290 [Burkholderia sp. MSMB2042]KVK75850.1 hypothetical protein WS91_17580 [Burkholderia sp. MSMB1498]